ncbi:hypothetical protein F9278_25405 [Streptomyces phaeolivaceus]|uniref:Uncharacterized protein n=1 Tax=Streptomyces phaeolivaceus TaxID=2653200 RepID=A0A5P8K6T4_9ACTN|nr:hypothetical protein F9278_25405 [Streptomyces phaeolivaceus]
MAGPIHSAEYAAVRHVDPRIAVVEELAPNTANYRCSTDHQAVIDVDTRFVVTVGRPLPGNRNDRKVWEAAVAGFAGRARMFTSMDDLYLADQDRRHVRFSPLRRSFDHCSKRGDCTLAASSSLACRSPT